MFQARLQHAALGAALLLSLWPAAQAQTARAKGEPIIAAIVSNYPPMEYKDPATGKRLRKMPVDPALLKQA